MRCPYCLERSKVSNTKIGNRSVYQCEACKTEIHRDYVEKKWIPRAFIGMVGFTGHGKTVYTTSLFYLLQEMQNIWDGFYCERLDQESINNVFSRLRAFKAGQLPESTPANFPRPVLFRMKNIPYYGERFISFYDTAGAVFEDAGSIANQGRYLAVADIAVFMLSLTDSGDDWQQEIERLLNIYVHGVYNNLHINLHRHQHLIVALSKADVLAEQWNADIRDAFNAGDYEWYYTAEKRPRIQALCDLSQYIEKWLRKKGCRGFVSLARDHFKSVEYTAISAIGSAPAGNKMGTGINPKDPKRVLDPLFWTLAKSQTWWRRLLG